MRHCVISSTSRTVIGLLSGQNKKRCASFVKLVCWHQKTGKVIYWWKILIGRTGVRNWSGDQADRPLSLAIVFNCCSISLTFISKDSSFNSNDIVHCVTGRIRQETPQYRTEIQPEAPSGLTVNCRAVLSLDAERLGWTTVTLKYKPRSTDSSFEGSDAVWS